MHVSLLVALKIVETNWEDLQMSVILVTSPKSFMSITAVPAKCPLQNKQDKLTHLQSRMWLTGQSVITYGYLLMTETC
jgi:hypothetical protein